MTLLPLLLAAVLGAQAVGTGQMSPTSDVSQNRVLSRSHQKAEALSTRLGREVWLSGFTGYDPTGVADQSPVLSAAALVAYTEGARLRIPKGQFRLNFPVSFDTMSVEGEGPDVTKLQFYGTGTAVTFVGWKGNTLSRIKIESHGAGQSGLVAYGEQTSVRDVYITEFDGVGFSPGIADSRGGYYATISNVSVINSTTWGSVGLYVRGGSPSTNSNVLSNVVVNGRFRKLVQIDGAANVIIGGDFDPWAANTGVDTVFEINGSQNVILPGVYVEQSSTKNYIPSRIVRCGANSSQNYVGRLNVQFSGWGSAAFEDLGWDNQCGSEQNSSKGYNYPFLPSPNRAGNLVFGTGFNVWDPSVSGTGARPLGWIDQNNSIGTNGTSDYVQMAPESATTVRGTARSLQITGTNADFLVKHHIVSGLAGDKSMNVVRVEQLRGKMLKCSIQALSTVASLGNLRVGCTGTGCGSTGQSHHSGSGTWELLTAAQRIPDDATKVWFELRASNGRGTKLTGSMWWSEPYCTVGPTMNSYAPAPLSDSLAQLGGPLVEAPSYVLPYVAVVAVDASLGNSFVMALSNSASATMVNPANGRPGQRITFTFTNSIGGNHTAHIYWSAGYKTATSDWTLTDGSALSKPATGYRRSITFSYDGSAWHEESRTIADVPN